MAIASSGQQAAQYSNARSVTLPRIPGGPTMVEPHGKTSLTLLARLRANEPAAWRTMVHLYTPLPPRWCARSGVRGDEAEDIAQEVFRKAAAHLATFRREKAGDTFRGWLRAITRTTLAEQYRRQARQPQGGGGTDAQMKLE